MPEEKDKEILLKYAYDNLDKIDNKEKKYFLPAVVTGVHLFSDGNGRTSRVLYQALDEHASNEDLQKEIKKTLSKDGRYITMDVNPSFVSSEVEMLVLKRYGWKFENNSWLKKELGEIKNGIFTGEEDNLDMNNPSYVFAEKFIEYAGIDGSSACTAVYASLDKETLKSILTSVYENKDGISPLLMQDNLSLKQWVDIIEKFNDLKKEYLQTFIDSFIEPEKFKAISEDMTIKDLFIKRVQENYKEFNS